MRNSAPNPEIPAGLKRGTSGTRTLRLRKRAAALLDQIFQPAQRDRKCADIDVLALLACCTPC